MRKMQVIDIVIPLSPEIPLHPKIDLHAPLTHAIELMVRHNVEEITVVSRDRPIGIVRLKDAFQEIGLQRDETAGTP